MRIGELAKVSQVPDKTIRYYETVGLLPASERDANGYRVYGQQDLERLVFIRRCRDLRIPLEQIKLLVSVQADKTASCRAVDRIIHDQLEKVRHTLEELKALEITLGALGRCDRSTVDECKILRQLKNTA